MLQRLLRQFTTGRRTSRSRRRYGHRGGSGRTGARLGAAVERFIRTRR